ncbi:MAG: hypothetical protein PHP98_02900 [Kiritimatiellae bacterium]|nr:hypothetical protein [Kiritimatiellia bacterium]
MDQMAAVKDVCPTLLINSMEQPGAWEKRLLNGVVCRGNKGGVKQKPHQKPYQNDFYRALATFKCLKTLAYLAGFEPAAF